MLREWLPKHLEANDDLTLEEHREAFEEQFGKRVSTSTIRYSPIGAASKPASYKNCKTIRLFWPPKSSTAGCVDTALPVGQCNYARSDKSVM